MAYLDPTGFGNWLSGDGTPLPAPAEYDNFTGANSFYNALYGISC